MIKLAITIVHNKIDQENFNQIEAIKPLIEKQTVLNDEYDDQGNVTSQFETYYYTLKGLILSHEVKFFQIIPFGVVPPSNLYDIDSHKVFYLKGDEDKTGDHPRFFNLGFKRGTDYGADIVIHLEDYKKFKVEDLPFYLNTLIDPNIDTEYEEDPSCKFSTFKLLKTKGLIDESKSKLEGLKKYKEK